VEPVAKKQNVLFICLFGGALMITIMFVAGYFLFLSVLGGEEPGFGRAIAQVNIQGEIFYDLDKVREIESYRDNDRVKAVLLYINSPGGGVAASQELYHAVQKLRDRKPVVAFMSELAASGGYYVACAADSIIALEGTITGSIGVIAMFLNTQELYRKIGLGVTLIKSGKYKDVGSPHREMTEEERKYIEGLLDTAYRQFLQAVSEGRGMPLDEVKAVAEGRIFSGEEARDKQLIDRIGTYEDAVDLAARLGGISGVPRILQRHRKGSWLDPILGNLGVKPPAASGIALKYIVP
jgi:protease-4